MFGINLFSVNYLPKVEAKKFTLKTEKKVKIIKKLKVQKVLPNRQIQSFDNQAMALISLTV